MIIKDFIILSFLFLFLLIKIISSIKKNIFLNYLSTPLIIFCIIIISLLNLYNKPSIYNFLITLGLILSLIGDVFNLFEKVDNSHLLFSIFFFFFTHLLYSIAFLKEYTFSLFHVFISILIILIVIILYNKFKFNIKNKSMKTGIFIYMLIVSITLLIAIGNLSTKISIKSLFITSGMFFFWLSDLFLGIDAFIKKIKYGSIIIWLLYAPAQFLIALSTTY